MAIIRVKLRKDAIRMKQSLSIAKMIAAAFKLEIIQDFDGEDTTLGQHIESAMKDARANNCPEMLRIPKRIQPLKSCERMSPKGEKNCGCSQYKPKDDIFDVRCDKCKHVHTVFKSYADLDKLPCILILVRDQF